MSQQAGFVQDAPRLGNTFHADPSLARVLARLVPPDARGDLAREWESLGAAASGRLKQLAEAAEADPPRHVPYDAWGRRVDRVEVNAAWPALIAEAVRLGLLALPYEPALGPLARIHQFALLHLYGASSAIASCPVAMTDGAARVLLKYADAPLVARAVPRLTSRDPGSFWTSGQWMTERTGGSDVSGTETIARWDGDAWRLSGAKWFTSSITSEVALTLARPENAPAGARGLSLFYLERLNAAGESNGIVIDRLKDKLGTRALPTAELTLQGAVALPVGALGDGIRKIAPLLNITRLHNAINACSLAGRAIALLRDYATRRVVFGALLETQPAFRRTLATLVCEYEAALAVTFEAARLLGRVEHGVASPDEAASLRALTPVVKLMTAKQAVAIISEALEGFGGAGYMEDTGLPVLLRNAQVLPIWEGTTDVLSLDTLRALQRDAPLETLRAHWSKRVAALRSLGDVFGRRADRWNERWTRAATWWKSYASSQESREAAARPLAYELGVLWAGALMLEQDAYDASQRASPSSVFDRWLASRAQPDVAHAVDEAPVPSQATIV